MAAQFAVVGRMTSVYKKNARLAPTVYHLQKLFLEKAPLYGSLVGKAQRWVMCRFSKDARVRWVQDDAQLRLLEDNIDISRDLEVRLEASARTVKCHIQVPDAGLQRALVENFSINSRAVVRKYGVVQKYAGGHAGAIPAGLEWVGKITDQVRREYSFDQKGRAAFRLWNPLSRLMDVNFSLVVREGELQDQTMNEAFKVARFMADVRLLEQQKPEDWKGLVWGKLAGWRQPVGELASWLDVSFETKPVTFFLDGNPLLIPEDPGDIISWLKLGMVDRSG
jgi:hypothetical protein